MQTICGELGCEGARSNREPYKMAIDFENTILGLVASVSRIEASMDGLAKK